MPEIKTPLHWLRGEDIGDDAGRELLLAEVSAELDRLREIVKGAIDFPYELATLADFFNTMARDLGWKESPDYDKRPDVWAVFVKDVVNVTRKHDYNTIVARAEKAERERDRAREALREMLRVMCDMDISTSVAEEEAAEKQARAALTDEEPAK